MAAVSGGAQKVSIERPSLSVVATPIGNLSDLSLRAIEVLSAADLLIAEDTRVAQRLLQRYAIRTPVTALHDHNEATASERLVDRMVREPLAAALVSDAGTPLIADPGYRLVRAAHAAGVPVRAVPGPCAAIAALSVAGLATDRFVFEGFLPPRSAARRKHLQGLQAESRTLVFYEAPHRVRDTLADMQAVFGGRREAAVAREITKLHETLYRGALDEILTTIAADVHGERGEFVILVEGATDDVTDVAVARALELVAMLSAHLPRGDAVKIAAKYCGVNRNRLYGASLDDVED